MTLCSPIYIRILILSNTPVPREYQTFNGQPPHTIILSDATMSISIQNTAPKSRLQPLFIPSHSFQVVHKKRNKNDRLRKDLHEELLQALQEKQRLVEEKQALMQIRSQALKSFS